MNEYLLDLINIGFGHSSGVAPWCWRYAKQLMDHACTLGLAKPYNFGRGKGKYITETKTDDIAHALQNDPKAKLIVDRYRKARIKRALDFIISGDGHFWDIKRDSTFLADLESELKSRKVPYTIEPPRWSSKRFYVSIKRQLAS